MNKDFRKMLGAHAEFKALQLKDMLTASDGTKKVNLSSNCLVTNPCVATLCIRLHMYRVDPDILGAIGEMQKKRAP